MNFCDVQDQIFKDEKTFNKTISTYFQGFEEILIPCLFTSEQSLYYTLPISKSFVEIEKLNYLLEKLVRITDGISYSSKIKEL